MKLVCDDCGRVFETIVEVGGENEGMVLVSEHDVFRAYHAHLDMHMLQSTIEEATENLCEAIDGEGDPDDPDDGEEMDEKDEKEEPAKPAGPSRFSRVK